jgi:selenocysteine lyase/cysteine desulfurase
MRDKILGVDREVPLLDGSTVRYVNLDNAASTPPLVEVMRVLEDFMPYYSSVHRGSGFKSRLSTMVYDAAHDVVAEFVGADPTSNTVVFLRNSTEAINKVSHCMPESSLVVTTLMEHHSNDLPWRDHHRVLYVRSTPEGRLDMDHLEKIVEQNAKDVALIAVTGASNVTGFVQPVHEIARTAHRVGARILVDCAQLAPHRRIDVLPDDNEAHLDFVVLSAHKMYAPFGTGALVGPAGFFLQEGPDVSGGGTVRAVTLQSAHWNGMPQRGEAGSPNVPGAIAMAVAAKALMEVGFDRIEEHESDLTGYALRRLGQVSGIRIYGEASPRSSKQRVGVIPFNMDGVHHFLLTAILGFEYGIGTRGGCFCAHPYVHHLLGMSEEDVEGWRTSLVGGDYSNVAGMVRMSLGCYSSREDVDRLTDGLRRIAAGDYVGKYGKSNGVCTFAPKNFPDPAEGYLGLW